MVTEFSELERIHKDSQIQSQFFTVEQISLPGKEGIVEEAVCGSQGVRMCGMNRPGTRGTPRTSSGMGAASFPGP